MCLYVAWQSTRSLSAIANLRRLCDKHVPSGCKIEVIDLMRNPELAKLDQIVAIPTLIRNSRNQSSGSSATFRLRKGIAKPRTGSRVSKIVAKIHHIKERRRAKADKPARYLLRLFTTGTTPKSTRALQNLRDICEVLPERPLLPGSDRYLPGARTRIESDIIAAPTLIKESRFPLDA